MTQILQYKCPICAFNSPAYSFVDKPSENFIELGYVCIRECKGKLGLPAVEKIPLCDFQNTEIGKRVLTKLKHDSLGLIHALQKYNYINENDFEFNVSGIRVRINKLKSALLDANAQNQELINSKEKIKSALLDANGEMQILINSKEKLKSALLDANGENQRLINKVNRVIKNNKQLNSALLDANGEMQILENSHNNTRDYETEIIRLRNIITQYENAAMGS